MVGADGAGAYVEHAAEVGDDAACEGDSGACGFGADDALFAVVREDGYEFEIVVEGLLFHGLEEGLLFVGIGKALDFGVVHQGKRSR